MFAQFPVPPLANYVKQQQFTSIVIILYHSFAYNNNCSIHLYNRNLRTTIILFTHNVALHKTNWILSELPFMISSLMNGLEGDRLCLPEISKNVNKLLTVLLLPVLFIRYTLMLMLLLFVYFFILFLCWCCDIILFIRWLCKQAHYFCLWIFFFW